MRTLALWILAMAVVATAGSALAADRNNDGIPGNEPTYTPGHYDGVTDRDETVIFPTSQDTWSVRSYPWWWQAGDTVYGTHTVALSSVNHADVSLKIANNSLTPGCGFFHLDFRIAGVTVGTLLLRGEDGTNYILGSFDFAAMTPPFELRYYETDTVYSGCGSLILDDTGLSSVVFRGGGPVPTQNSTWGAVKALYR